MGKERRQLRRFDRLCERLLDERDECRLLLPVGEASGVDIGRPALAALLRQPCANQTYESM